MPGGRLSQEDRQYIATALAEGQGYAEIARRLGRPTSTVSREVARNTGSDGYKADLAQRDTARRARRGKRASQEPLPDAADYGRGPEAVREFVEQFMMLMTATGLSRMTARVLTCLFTTDSGTLTAAELVQQLQVSPASISKAIGHLETLDFVRRERDSGGRRERYVVDDDVWRRAWMASARINADWAKSAARGAEVFGAATPAGARLRHMATFFASLSEDMAAGPTAAHAADARTVLAALVHAGSPLTEKQLATALGWPLERVASAIHDAEQHLDWTAPVTLERTATGTYTIAASPDHLTASQREALTRREGP